MWVWGAYFNPHRFTYGGMACNFPVSIVIAIPTLLETLFSFEPNRRFFERAAVTLLMFRV